MDTRVMTMTTFLAILLALPLLIKKLLPKPRRVVALDLPRRREELLYDTDDLLE